MKLMFVCLNEFDVALCDVTLNNAALSLSLVGHPRSRGSAPRKIFATMLFMLA